MTPRSAIANHWPEYLMEAWGLGTFMVSAGVFAVLLESPGSPVHHTLAEPMLRRGLMGLAMGVTAIAIIYSPWGKQSGAHINPAVTLTFWSLGKVAPWDAVFYVSAQFCGGLAGVWVTALVVGQPFTAPPVSWIVTVPGVQGPWVAFAAESIMAFIVMTIVLCLSNSTSLHRYTGLIVGALVAVYITIEAPFSGMSINPARTFASGLPSGQLQALWVYFSAPLLGMAAAAWLYRLFWPGHAPLCAKLNHHTHRRCIFRCRFAEQTRLPADKSLAHKPMIEPHGESLV